MMNTSERILYVDAGGFSAALDQVALEAEHADGVVELRLERRPGDPNRFRVTFTEEEQYTSRRVRRYTERERLDYERAALWEELAELHARTARVEERITEIDARLADLSEEKKR